MNSHLHCEAAYATAVHGEMGLGWGWVFHGKRNHPEGFHG